MSTVPSPTTLIEASGISVRHGAVTVLDDVTFSLHAGEIVTIVGPNGSGKSTMVRALIGAVPVTSGSVTRIPGLRLGYVPQRLQLERALPMSVRRFFDLPTRINAQALSEVADRVHVAHLLERQLFDLSGGQLQRVLLARALLNKPQVLVLDEATQGLDQRGSAGFYHQVETVRNELGCAVLMVSHELHVVMSASDRVICLNGHVCCEGAPDVVSSQPEYRALFGTDTQGALALYRHEHDHSHCVTHDGENAPVHRHAHVPDQAAAQARGGMHDPDQVAAQRRGHLQDPDQDARAESDN
ncbi:MAG: ATP-binding cassette domain-containing protein [Granulosicoccus sp.]|nr:ATP-binding cassette domain-containing protein [Granulosicoccus sp.]